MVQVVQVQYENDVYARVVEDSISPDGIRLTTLELKAPKIIDAEFEKHRMISSNSRSDRARPFNKMLEEIKNSPYLPKEVYYNERGMEGKELISNEMCEELYADIESVSYDAVYALSKWDGIIHKQHLNRYLLPWAWQWKVATATNWRNFFKLRLASDAQPEFRRLAECMYEVMELSEPKELTPNEWHLPYISEKELDENTLEDCKKASVARSARVSYVPYTQAQTSIEKDLQLFDTLREEQHLSPFENVAKPMVESKTGEEFNGGSYWEDGITHMTKDNTLYSGNFRGWIQYRHLL